MKGVLRFVVLVLCCSAAGCANFRSDWSDTSVEEINASANVPPKTDPGVSLLDVAFVSLLIDPESLKNIKPDVVANNGAPIAEKSSAHDGIDELWRWVDETAIPADVREQLRLNGLRVGRVHTHSEFTRALDSIRRVPLDEAAKFLASAEVGSDISQSSRRIPCRLGRRYELPVRQPAPGTVATLVSYGGRTIGKSLDGPQPLFAVTVQPLNASSVRVRMQPEIQFGDMRQTWVSSDSALRIDSRRESWALEELAFEITAGDGGTIVAGAVMPPFGLGEQMFTGKSADGDTDHVVVVLRVAKLPDMMPR